MTDGQDCRIGGTPVKTNLGIGVVNPGANRQHG